MKVGYAEDSCTAHEFNVTKYLKPGENLLAVEVYRWSDGSFLEDQDFFRYSGIYRHVMLFSPPQVEIRDFFWKPTLANLEREAAAARGLPQPRHPPARPWRRLVRTEDRTAVHLPDPT